MNNPNAKIRLAAVLGALLVSIHPTMAFMPAAKTTPSFDKRRDVLPAAITAGRQEAAAKLQERMPTVRVEYDPVTGAPGWISSSEFLSQTTDEEIARTGAFGLATDDPHRAIKAFMIENTALFEHGPEVLANAVITREFVAKRTGLRTVVWQQQLDGIPVFEGVLIGHITKRGELVNISSQFLPDVEKASGLDKADRSRLESASPISSTQALVSAAADTGEEHAPDAIKSASAGEATAEKSQTFQTAPLLGNARVKLVWLPMNRSTVRLCWQVEFTTRANLEAFRSLVDATSGEVLVRQNRTFRSDASYRVYTSDSPSPFSPGHSTPSSVQPSLVARQLVTLDSVSPTASPEGWVQEGSNPETIGNNVDARAWRNLSGNPAPRPQAASRVFDFPLDLNQGPETYTSAAVVNLFYWGNWMHDRLYDLGFTEAAGNFQYNNFGRGGSGGDEMMAYAQAGADSGFANNAFYLPASDGDNGQIYMFIWNYPTPNRDGDFDAEIMLHEYTHGLSDRMIGGGVGISALQTAGMGEGWSDFYALALLSASGDDVNGNYAAGGYSTYQLEGLTENYYYGFRRYPFTTDMSKNPLTFKDIDPAQADPHPGVPLNPLFGPPTPFCDTFDANSPCEPHFSGQVWCVTLWEARAKLINRYGYATGNQLILQLVTDGMKLCPPNPTFIQARDAILQADLVNNGGVNLGDLWAAFAKRGMGTGASALDSSTTSGVVESFTVPTFTSTSALIRARYNHTATLLQNGKVLVAGGYGPGGWRNSAELYDPASGIWTTTGLMVAGRDGHTATLLPDGRVLAAGGTGLGGYQRTAQLYNPQVGTWTATGPMNSARLHHVATLLPNGTVLVAGGFNSPGSYLISAEVYNPNSGTWTLTVPMSTARVRQTQTLLPNGLVLVAGGLGPGGELSSGEFYEYISQVWLEANSLATARWWHTTTSLPGGNVLVAGGLAGGINLDSAELYDWTTGYWSGVAPMIHRRGWGHTGTLLSAGQVLVAGGFGNGGILRSAEVYGPGSNSWSPVGLMVAHRYYHTATKLPNGRVLLAGGVGPGGCTSSAELYDPEAGQ